MTLPQLLQGRTVYRNSSYAPTRGTNNPAGYIQRGLNQQQAPSMPQIVHGGNVGPYGGVSSVGSDGQSDTRSGLAARALNSQLQHQGVGTSVAGQTAIGAPTPQLNIPSAPIADISPIGTIKLPYNFESNQNILAQKKAANEALLKLQQQRQEDAVNYARAIFENKNQFGTLLAQTLNDNAGRGTAFSSGYGKSVGDNYTKFNDLINQLQSNESRSLNNYQTGANQVQSDLNDFLLNAALQQGFIANKSAGKWGIGPKKKKKKK